MRLHERVLATQFDLPLVITDYHRRKTDIDINPYPTFNRDHVRYNTHNQYTIHEPDYDFLEQIGLEWVGYRLFYRYYAEKKYGVSDGKHRLELTEVDSSDKQVSESQKMIIEEKEGKGFDVGKFLYHALRIPSPIWPKNPSIEALTPEILARINLSSDEFASLLDRVKKNVRLLNQFIQ